MTNTITRWVSVWGEIDVDALDPTLRWNVLNAPKRKDGNLDMRFAWSRRVYADMEAYMRQRYERAA